MLNDSVKEDEILLSRSVVVGTNHIQDFYLLCFALLKGDEQQNKSISKRVRPQLMANLVSSTANLRNSSLCAHSHLHPTADYVLRHTLQFYTQLFLNQALDITKT